MRPVSPHLAFISLLLASPLTPLRAAVPNTTSSFEIRDPKTKEVYFTGQETLSQEDKTTRKETLYFDNAKKEVQKESFEFDAASLRAVQFNSNNALTGEESSLSPKDAGLQITYKADHAAKTDSSVLKGDKNLFLAATAGDLILQNWDNLIAGKAVKFDLVVPSRLEAVPFQIVKRETLTVGEESREVFSLMPQNILIRMLAPHLEFQYGQDKKIRQAAFPSSLPIRGAKDKMVEMVIKG